jgi:5-methylcytosine-specific restriction endonuclease McrA
MSYRDRKRSKRMRRDKGHSFFPGIDEQSVLSAEKQRARVLRKSPWWRKKISTGICHYCGKKFNPVDLTMDHKIPLARGGTSEKSNLVPACKECNNRKKYLLPLEWEEYLDRLKKPEGEGSEDDR